MYSLGYNIMKTQVFPQTFVALRLRKIIKSIFNKYILGKRDVG